MVHPLGEAHQELQNQMRYLTHRQLAIQQIGNRKIVSAQYDEKSQLIDMHKNCYSKTQLQQSDFHSP